MRAVDPLDELVGGIESGCVLAMPPDYSGVAMAATRALVRRGAKDLHLVALPTAGLAADLLVGVGAVASIEAAAVTLGESGTAPRFTAAIAAGRLRMRDATCPALHAAFQAGEKGVPFMPLRGVIGSDIIAHRPDWRVVDNPFAGDDPILLVPAIRPDVALFHAEMADRDGNVWIGRRRELMTMAHAARRTLVTVERIEERNLLEDARLAPGVLPGLYVERVVCALQGAWPLALPGVYPADEAHLAAYARDARTDEGFRAYLETFVLPRRAA